MEQTASSPLSPAGSSFRGRFGPWPTRRSLVALFLVGLGGLVAGILLAVRSGGGGEERAWLAAARHALAQPAWQCRPSGTPGQGLSLPGLGHVDRICVTAGVVSFVTEEQQPSGGFQPEGVLYVTGRAVARYPDACLAHLNGAWWRFVPPTPDCPSGYTISGGG